jgi:hypothetical protein
LCPRYPPPAGKLRYQQAINDGNATDGAGLGRSSLRERHRPKTPGWLPVHPVILSKKIRANLRHQRLKIFVPSRLRGKIPSPSKSSKFFQTFTHFTNFCERDTPTFRKFHPFFCKFSNFQTLFQTSRLHFSLNIKGDSAHLNSATGFFTPKTLPPALILSTVEGPHPQLIISTCAIVTKFITSVASQIHLSRSHQTIKKVSTIAISPFCPMHF